MNTQNLNVENILDPKNLKKYICKVEIPQVGYVTGFFCKIPTLKIEDYYYSLIILKNILKEKVIDSKIEIKIILDDDSNDNIILSIDSSRFVFQDELTDITIIEIKDSDKKDELINFLNIDEDYYTYEDESAYLIDFSGDKKINYSVGLIQEIKSESNSNENNYNDDIKFKILCFNNKKSFGGPIIFDNKVIGIHYGNKNNERKYWNSGIYIVNLVHNFYIEKDWKFIFKKKQRKKNEMKSNNEKNKTIYNEQNTKLNILKKNTINPNYDHYKNMNNPQNNFILMKTYTGQINQKNNIDYNQYNTNQMNYQLNNQNQIQNYNNYQINQNQFTNYQQNNLDSMNLLSGSLNTNYYSSINSMDNNMSQSQPMCYNENQNYSLNNQVGVNQSMNSLQNTPTNNQANPSYYMNYDQNNINNQSLVNQNLNSVQNNNILMTNQIDNQNNNSMQININLINNQANINQNNNNILNNMNINSNNNININQDMNSMRNEVLNNNQIIDNINMNNKFNQINNIENNNNNINNIQNNQNLNIIESNNKNVINNEDSNKNNLRNNTMDIINDIENNNNNINGINNNNLDVNINQNKIITDNNNINNINEINNNNSVGIMNQNKIITDNNNINNLNEINNNNLDVNINQNKIIKENNNINEINNNNLDVNINQNKINVENNYDIVQNQNLTSLINNPNLSYSEINQNENLNLTHNNLNSFTNQKENNIIEKIDSNKNNSITNQKNEINPYDNNKYINQNKEINLNKNDLNNNQIKEINLNKNEININVNEENDSNNNNIISNQNKEIDKINSEQINQNKEINSIKVDLVKNDENINSIQIEPQIESIKLNNTSDKSKSEINQNNQKQNNIQLNQNTEEVNQNNILKKNNNVNHINEEHNNKNNNKNNINNNNNIKNNKNINSINEIINNKNIDFEDVYPYINEKKINIIFEIEKREKKGVKVPKTLTLKELFFTAYYIKYRDEDAKDPNFLYKNILIFFYDGKKLQNNDDPIIKYIKDNDKTILIQEGPICPNINFGKIMEIKDDSKRISIEFSDTFPVEGNVITSFHSDISSNITTNEMIPTFSKINLLDLNRVDIIFEYNGKNLEPNNTKLKSVFKGDSNKFFIKIRNKISLNNVPGKILKATYTNKENILNIYAGTLQKISKFYESLKSNKDLNKIIKFKDNNLKVNEIILKEDDERVFSSKDINIKNDFKFSTVKKN